jgi:hypothetical protein
MRFSPVFRRKTSFNPHLKNSMPDTKQDRHPHGISEGESDQQIKAAYWRRARRDWRIWIAVFLVCVGMFIYVTSGGFAFLPHGLKPPASSAVGK